ncbi:MAG: phosphatase PAP2 family protein [Prevotellaceae bacterium]|jgi:hypothetical protein|nr:phosphatase PAP2 family protein [Prevotellaceae bacterium]
MRRNLLCVTALLGGVFASYPLYAARPDSVNAVLPACTADCSPTFRVRQIIVPTVLVATGASCLFVPPMKEANKAVNQRIKHWRGRPLRADDYLQYVPVASYLMMGSLGVPSKHSFPERFVMAATSYLAMGFVVNSLKHSIRNLRPDHSAYNSFPSGHTATAFCGAELIRMEYGTGYGLAAYTAACGVGFLRMYNNRHWAKDVLVGAGIGILSARASYWLHTSIGKWLHHTSNRKKTYLCTDLYNGVCNNPSRRRKLN